jgi:hypothetical protein
MERPLLKAQTPIQTREATKITSQREKMKTKSWINRSSLKVRPTNQRKKNCS